MNPFYGVKREKSCDMSFDVDENGVISYSDPFCKHCHSHKVTKHGYNVRDLIKEDGEHYIAKVQRYYCLDCGKYSQTEFIDQYENYCNELYQIFCGIIISHETVRKVQIITNNLYYLYQEIKPSGFYCYDVQWELLDDGYHYRRLLFDFVNNTPVEELLAPDEDLKTTYDFINKSVKPIDRKAIVTDLKPGYDGIMKKLEFKHQYYIYHLRLAIQFKKENEKISEYKLNKKVKKEIENLKDEINIYNNYSLNYLNNKHMIKQ